MGYPFPSGLRNLCGRGGRKTGRVRVLANSKETALLWTEHTHELPETVLACTGAVHVQTRQNSQACEDVGTKSKFHPYQEVILTDTCWGKFVCFFFF